MINCADSQVTPPFLCLRMRNLPKTKKTVRGNANMRIDELIHPYFKENPTFILLDGLLHAIVEQNPSESLRKFLVYNLPELRRHLVNKPKPIKRTKRYS
jgi:hypothetical protein